MPELLSMQPARVHEQERGNYRMRGHLFSAALIASAGAALAAENAIVTGDKLRETLSGKTVYLMTPIGSEIPIRYKANGTLQGSISGTLAVLGGRECEDGYGTMVGGARTGMSTVEKLV
jgi:hypothetical protein